MPNRIGQCFGQYRLTRLLGRGSFGEVYLGEHVHKYNTLAAVKVLQARLSPEDLKEFVNEASTTFRLQHPNIVQLLDFGIGPDDMPFLAMAYASKGTLRQRHPKGTQLPLETVVTYIKHIAAALQHTHDERLIHRDIKPENILLGPSDEVWLSDFGIVAMAHSTRSLNIPDGAAGTLPYMAPEQIQGKPRPASDQYALAIMVYEWLCGERPFNGTAIEIATQHAVTPPPSLRQKVPTISPHVEQVVFRALAKKPEERFENVQAFAQALVQACQPKPPIGTTLLTYSGHADAVWAVAWSPDGKRIASGSHDKTVQVWDLAFLRTYGGHSSRVFAVAWSPDASRIASGSVDKTVQIWDASTGALLRIYGGHFDIVRTIAWSPDGGRIASGSSDEIIQIWDASTGALLHTYSGHSATVCSLAWSPDGRHIASGSVDKTVQIWDASTGALLRTYGGHSGQVFAVKWSPDGRHIASGSPDKTVQVWDADTGALLCTYGGHSGRVYDVAWSPDGERIASGSHDKTVQVWQAV